MDSANWITLHWMRLPEPLHAADMPAPAPGGADLWRVCPQIVLDEKGIPTNQSAEYCALGLYETRAAADAVFADPAPHLPLMAQAVESWHALAAPVAHHGEVNWRGRVETDTIFAPNKAISTEGPMLVLTTAGFDEPSAVPLTRQLEFLAGVQDVLTAYAAVPGNLRRDVFSGRGVDGMEGYTVSLWDDARAMLGAAYKPGLHKDQMDSHADKPMFDRSSWSRFRLLESKGSWDGDPLAQTKAA